MVGADQLPGSDSNITLHGFILHWSHVVESRRRKVPVLPHPFLPAPPRRETTVERHKQSLHDNIESASPAPGVWGLPGGRSCTPPPPTHTHTPVLLVVTRGAPPAAVFVTPTGRAAVTPLPVSLLLPLCTDDGEETRRPSQEPHEPYMP